MGIISIFFCMFSAILGIRPKGLYDSFYIDNDTNSVINDNV